jgi:hypothetical protein
MKKVMYLGDNETNKEMVFRLFCFIVVNVFLLFLSVEKGFDDNIFFLIFFAVLIFPMASRLGALLNPKSNYEKIVADIKKKNKLNGN